MMYQTKACRGIKEGKTMVIKRKMVKTNAGKQLVTLVKQDGMYSVRVDGVGIYSSANQLFAVQKFNEV